ncbi:MAG TPA: GAF domain-containing protein [Anaerolineales bacterium]|nr:GAF domain-containing protein [Anaerolineales bacterium]
MNLAPFIPDYVLTVITLTAAALAVSLLALLLIRQRRKTAALNQKLDASNQARERIESARMAITPRMELQETLAEVCAQVQNLTQADRWAIHLVDGDQNLVRMPLSKGFSREFLRLNRIYSAELEERTACLRSGKPMVVMDIHSVSPPSAFLEQLVAEGVEAFADFPLLSGETVLGYVSIYFISPGTMPPEVLEPMSDFSEFAGTIIHNAILFARTETALLRRAHQLEILENVGRELAAASHSDSLFELILDNALEFTNSPWGGLYLFDPETKDLQIKAGRGFAKTGTLDAQQNDPQVSAVEKGEPVLITARDPGAFEVFLSGGALSHLSVPLIHNGQAVGVLSLESPLEGAFTENDQLFISQLATQAAVALVNASLYSEARQRLQAQTILYQASRQLVGSLELRKIVESVVNSFHETIQSSASGAYLWDEVQQAYRLAGSAGAYPGAVDHLPKVVDRSAWEESSQVRLGTGLLQLPTEASLAQSPLSPFPGCQTLALPLARGDKLLGLILAYIPEKRTLNDDDLQLSRAIVAQGAIAVQNALLFKDVVEGRDRLEAVLNSVDEGVIMIDDEERVIIANEIIQAMTGVLPEDLLGKPFTELPPQVLALIGVQPTEGGSILRALMQPDRLHTPRVTLPGSRERAEKTYERFASPVWGEGQEGIGWVFVLRDVTEESQHNQARELLTETLVHDLRSPIGAVGSALNVLEEALAESLNDPTVEQSLDIARRSTNRIVGLVESMLDISRMEAGLIELDQEPFDLGKAAAGLIHDHTHQANELGIILRNEIPVDEILVIADQEKVDRVLVNLLDNALKFTPEGGRISLTAAPSSPGGAVEVALTDTGPGVAEEHRLMIFDRFSQVPGVRSRRRGSGLGLTFCRLVIEAHGGRIWVEPASGGGSRFVFTLNPAPSIAGSD